MTIVKLKSFVAGRVRRLRAKMLENGLDGLIVTEPVDVTYLTGFSGDDSVLVLTGRRKVLVTDSRYVEQVRQECPGLALKVRKGEMSPAVAEVITRSFPASPRKYGGGGRKRNKGSKQVKIAIGIDPDTVTVSQSKSYRKALGQGLKPSKGFLSAMRQCKDDFEVSQIRRAVRIAEVSIKEVLGWLKVGVSEQETAAQLEYEMARRGGRPFAFESIVAWGAHAAQPHAIPGRQRLRRGQMSLFDWGATVGGYKSDLTRCYGLGRIRPVFADAYRWVLEAQLSAIEAVKPGAALVEVDAAARKALPRSLPMYGHGTGHGVGLQIHEAPVINDKSKGVLEEGMVITIEPGVYVPGQFGIRIEDDVLVTVRPVSPEQIGQRPAFGVLEGVR